MPRKVTATEQFARDAHFAEHDRCWMHLLMGWKQTSQTQLHHIAGRGRRHERRENYAALCAGCHRAIQSRKDSELLCLALKQHYDPHYYSAEVICSLRGRARTAWTDDDVLRAYGVLLLMREVARNR